MRLALVLLATLPLALAACDGDDAEPEPTTTATTVTTASPAADGTPGATATRSPGSGELPVEEVADAIVRETFAPGEQVDAQAQEGFFFLDVETGEVERIAIAPEHGGTGYVAAAAISANNRYFLASTAEGQWLVDRADMRAWHWPHDNWSPIALGDDSMVLAAGSAMPERDFDYYHVFLPEWTVTPLGLDPAERLGSGIIAGDGRYLWLWGDAPGSDGTPVSRLHRIDMESGEAEELAARFGPREGYAGPRVLLQQAPGEQVQVAAWYDREKPDTGGFTIVRVYTPAGELVTEVEVPYVGYGGTLDFSPDGRFVAYDSLVRAAENTGLGAPVWTAVVVQDVDSGEIVFRVKGAELGFGDQLFGSRWLADGSGLVVSGELAGNALDRAGLPENAYYVVTPAGEIEELSGGTFAYHEAPVPSPHDADLVALGRAGVLDLDSGEERRAGVEPLNTAHVAPWGDKPGEIRFAMPHGGHDGGFVSVQPARPIVERPPFDARIRFVVGAEGDCLNLRTFPDVEVPDWWPEAEPTPAREVIACIEDGSEVELAEGADLPDAVGGPSAVWTDYDAGRYWLYVDAGEHTGWVASDFLRWAE